MTTQAQTGSSYYKINVGWRAVVSEDEYVLGVLAAKLGVRREFDRLQSLRDPDLRRAFERGFADASFLPLESVEHELRVLLRKFPAQFKAMMTRYGQAERLRQVQAWIAARDKVPPVKRTHRKPAVREGRWQRTAAINESLFPRDLVTGQALRVGSGDA